MVIRPDQNILPQKIMTEITKEINNNKYQQYIKAKICAMNNLDFVKTLPVLIEYLFRHENLLMSFIDIDLWMHRTSCDLNKINIL